MSTSQRPQKPKTAAQLASDANHAAQMEMNVRMGRHMPPRDPDAPRETHEERHGRPTHKR